MLYAFLTDFFKSKVKTASGLGSTNLLGSDVTTGLKVVFHCPLWPMVRLELTWVASGAPADAVTCADLHISAEYKLNFLGCVKVQSQINPV